MSARKSFARVLKRFREEAKLSQEDLAHKSGLSMRSISLFECDKQQPSISSIESICLGLGISMQELIKAIEEDMLLNPN